MKKELQEQLFAIEPSWFDRTNIKESLMCFGFEVGDGWFTLLEQLLKQIKSMNPPEGFQIQQVKEKFGGLRFYHNGAYKSDIDAVVNFAEGLSYKICEECGNPGSTKGGKGWIRCLCLSCREKLNTKIDYSVYGN